MLAEVCPTCGRCPTCGQPTQYNIDWLYRPSTTDGTCGWDWANPAYLEHQVEQHSEQLELAFPAPEEPVNDL